MRAVFPWVLRGGWAVVPFTVGPAVAQAVHHHSAAAGDVVVIGGWVVWLVGLVATLVPHPISLTAFRSLAPAVAAGALGAAVAGGARPLDAGIGAAWAAGVTATALLPATGMVFVNGPAYPNERRFPLAAPGALLLGPIELAWAVMVGLPAAGALLLSARQWVVGGGVMAAGVVAASLLARALHVLSRRWVVFVPAGVVLHDPMSLGEPVLFRRQLIESLAPAPAGTDSLDLTLGAPGLALELILRQKVEMTRLFLGSRAREQGSSARLLFTPSRPGAVLAEATARRIYVAGPPPRTSSPS